MKHEIIENGTVVNTIVASPEFMSDNYPAGNYRLAAELEPPPAPEPEWAWYIDHGPFTDRLGAAATVTIDTSTAPGFVAIRADFARRKWIDLKDPRVAATVGYLAGQPLPGLGTLATPLLTAEQAAAVLNTPVTPAENLALRKLYFS
jgi:hypothetical protein